MSIHSYLCIRYFTHVSLIKIKSLFQNDGKHDARYRIKEEKYLMVDVKVPQEGQYGLDIFARENWDQQMVHCCKYLINCDVDKYCD